MGRDTLLLLGITLLAAGLRLYGLEVQSLWNDELSSWSRSAYPTLSEVLALGARPDVHPPGFHVLLNVTQRVVGSEPWALRLPAALAGIALVPTIYFFGRRLYGSAVGLMAAALAAVSWCPIYYSQEARAYSLLALVAAFSSLCCYELLDPPRQFARSAVWWAIAYCLSSALLLYTHYFGALLFALQVCWLLMESARRRPVPRSVAIAVVGALALYAPWLGAMIEDVGGTSWMKRPTASAWFDLFTFFYGSVGLAVASLVVMVCFVAVQLCHNRPFNTQTPTAQLRADWTLASWLVAPPAIAFVLSVLGETSVYSERNLIICLPPALLLLARCILSIPVSRGLRVAVVCAWIAASFTNTVWLRDYYERPTKGQFREVTAFVSGELARTPDAAVIGVAYSQTYLDYYLARQGSKPVDLMVGIANSIPILEQLLARRQPRYVWYIAAHRQPDGEFAAYLSSRFQLADKRRFVKAEARLLVPRTVNSMQGISHTIKGSNVNPSDYGCCTR